MSSFLRRIWYLLNRWRFDRELANDLEFHREMQRGRDSAPLGNTLRLREEARDAWGWTWIDRLGQDLRYATRTMRRSPGFATAAILILAIGIGCNAAIFGFFNLVMLQPTSVKNPESLLRFHRRNVHQYAFALPYPEADFFRRHARTLRSVIAVSDSAVAIDGEERLANASFVTANFFADLGGRCSFGRPFDVKLDEAASADPLVVLAHGFWLRHFAGDRSVVGRTLRINGRAATIAGVAAADFRGVGSGISGPAFWAPITQQPYFVSGSQLLTDVSVEGPGVLLWGRLQDGISARAAEEELRQLAAELRRRYPEAIWEDEQLPSEPGGYLSSMMSGNRRGTGSEQRIPIYPVFALAGILTLLILVVACSNLGGMLLARAVARQRELSIRLAIGASSARLVRQLFTESLLLASMGSLAGLLVGNLLLRALLVATDVPAWLRVSPDWRVWTFALGAGFLASLLFGLFPGVQAGRRRNSQAMRRFLVGAQVASSCILLIVAALLSTALNRLLSESPGFEHQRVIAVSPQLWRNSYSPPQAQAYLSALKERLRILPGVRATGLAQSPPLGHITVTAGLDTAGKHVEFQINQVDSEFFETMRIPILRGRAPHPNERHVFVISQSMARLAWPGEDALGKTLILGDPFTVVGISENIRNVKFGESETSQIYAPIEDAIKPSLSMLVRTDGSPRELARAATEAAASLDPNVFPIVELLQDSYEAKLQGARMSATAVDVLAAIAQVLACFGIVSVVSFAVTQRTKEIGIRMALGAQQGHVLRVVMQQLSVPVGTGVIAGLAGAAALSQFLKGRLYGVGNLDAPPYIAAIALFALSAGLAAAVPAQKALRIDPLRALHHD